MPSSNRINKLATLHGASRYLEIGVQTGHTFFQVGITRKVAVDPVFKFNPGEYKTPGNFFFMMKSDDFFTFFPSSPPANEFMDSEGGIKFDLIFIDGLHHYDQSLRDFENSLAFAHDNTIWLLDDTVPCDPYSSLPDPNMCYRYRERAGLKKKSSPAGPWHGDVFKTVFAIHEKYKDYSYCTVMNEQPQTIVWKSPSTRESLFHTPEVINSLNYFDIMKFAHIFAPITEDSLLDLVGHPVNPSDFKSPTVDEIMIYQRLVSV